jgi:phosphatidyl-myo-inositol dimannoside synthase
LKISGTQHRSNTPIKIVYLAVGVFDKGGISRYCRFQIRALRELVGEQNVRVLSLLSPGENDFEEPFEADYCGGGFGPKSEASFFFRGMSEVADSPRVIWSSHVRFVPNGLMLRLLTGAPFAVNVYGRELWGGKLQWLHKKILRRADLVISDCHFSADFVTCDYAVARAKLQVVWDCVDLEKFRPRPRNAELMRRFGIPNDAGKRYVLTLGRIEKRSRYKGYDRLIDAVAALRDYPSIILLFAGAGDDLERLRQRTRAEGLEDRAFFLGSVPEDSLCEIYNLCDVFALVSDRGHGRGEGVPLAPLEAAACGKPIIVGDEDGSREAVVQGENGFIVSPRDPSALRQVLTDLLLRDEMRKAMGHAARLRIERYFGYETFREKTRRALTQLTAADSLRKAGNCS